ncbi:hypothetical protein [Kamptonema sp. UHCC 0994]|uniref:hypothetical protein n=1 Tax=Kamptonema sp. UHCC 0994 TaxID=3031329 RepID=UPI0023B9C8C7|nr:hypothetical protein [Kamptonema sp. UHCC 0994]MDF0553406.1 hypothetical protein [Kamptonema sp. UHCC 0994]
MTSAKPTKTIIDPIDINNPSDIVIEIAQTELEKLNTPDATICWYNQEDTDNPEQSIKFNELAGELQQAILKKLQLCKQGKFITLEEYKNQKHNNEHKGKS